MNPQKFVSPFFIFFLIVPFGISSGFVSIALPYQLIQNGFSVGQTATVVAVGASASLLRFVFGPIVDTTLSLRKWYIISLLASIGALLVLATTPFTIKGLTLLTIIVFISQIASNFLFLPVSGFMAKSIEERRKGLASGCLQGGMLLGTGAGGGAGLWLLTHYGSGVSGIIMCLSLIHI
jgi:PAT family beta-lactamase induction signal transducer AmpG